MLWISQEYDVEDSLLPLQPSLDYAAPELVRSNASSAGCFSDIFSFGCLAYHLVARKPLFDCHNNVKMVCFILNSSSSIDVIACTFKLSFVFQNTILEKKGVSLLFYKRWFLLLNGFKITFFSLIKKNHVL